MNQKIALCDVCDVCVDLLKTTIEAAKLNIDMEKVVDWDMFNVLNEEERLRVFKLFNDPEYWRSLPPVKGVHEGLEGLMSQGYRIHFITSPWFTCVNWEGVRRAWLTEQFKWYHPLDMTSTSEKFRFNGDILIDDRPKHVKLWQEAHPGKDSWLFNTPFNRFFDWPLRGVWSSTGITVVTNVSTKE